MDRVGQVRASAVRRIVDRIVAKRDVAHRRVKVILGERRVLECFLMNGRFRVKAGGNARGDRVQFDARAPRAGIQPFGHQAEEMPDAHRGFENVRARLQSEPLYRLPDGPNDLGRRVVRVGSGGARRGVLLFRQKFFQFAGDALPLLRRLRAPLHELRRAEIPKRLRNVAEMGTDRNPAARRLYIARSEDAAADGESDGEIQNDITSAEGRKKDTRQQRGCREASRGRSRKQITRGGERRSHSDDPERRDHGRKQRQRRAP